MKVSIIKQSNNESIVLSNVDVTIIGRGVFGVRINVEFHNNSQINSPELFAD